VGKSLLGKWTSTKTPNHFVTLNKNPRIHGEFEGSCDPDGIRTRVAGVKGLCPRPLDDGAKTLLYTAGCLQASRARRTQLSPVSEAFSSVTTYCFLPCCVKWPVLQATQTLAQPPFMRARRAKGSAVSFGKMGQPKDSRLLYHLQQKSTRVQST
jgi:hypothetical protein